MRPQRRRVFEGGSLLPDFLSGSIVGDVADLATRTEAAERDKLGMVAAQRDYARQWQRLVFDGWGMDDVAASLGNVAMGRNGSVQQAGLRLGVGGSIRALGVCASEQRTAGSCTVKVYIGGAVTELTAALDGDNRQVVLETADAGEVTFEAEEEITLRVATTGSWGPITADVQAWISVDLEVN